MKILLFLASLAGLSVVLADYGELRRVGYNNILEFRLSDGSWGTVCSSGFDYYAARAACNQLGYSSAYYDIESYSRSYSYKSPVICDTECYSYNSRLTDCDLTMCNDDNNDYSCYNIITLNCYISITDYYYYDNYYYDDGSSSGSSGATIGGVIGGVLIFVLVFFIVACRFYIRSSYVQRNQSRTVMVTQRRTPRILIARVTRTVSSGPPPPPAYTPSDPNAGYTPVPPRGYQPVPTTDCTAANSTNNPSVTPDNIPSDPPPAYIPVVPTNNASVPVPPDSTQ